MDWVHTMRPTVAAELSGLRAKMRVKKEELDRAAQEYEECQRLHTELARIATALDQLDPLTALPEPPL